MKTQKNINFKGRRTHPALMFLTALVAAASVLPSSVLAWGPERATFTMENPADYVTFNSITNNNVLGDERNFVRVAPAGAGVAFEDEIEIVPGQEYEIYIGYHNNAKSSLNTVAAGGKGIALDTKLTVNYPSVVTPTQRGEVSAIIYASNANPQEVWDEAYFTTKYPEVSLHYKPGSAKIFNSWATDGNVLPDALFSETGTYLGYDALDGILPGCAEFSGHVIITLVAEGTSSDVQKTVSLDGVNFYESVQAKPGDVVTYKVVFNNRGNVSLTNVTFKDTLPAGMTLVPGSTYLYDAAHENGEKLADLIDKNGHNTGMYGPGAEATLIYQAQVNKDAPCSNLVNRIAVTHNGGEVSDGATVEVTGCIPSDLPETGPAEIVLALVIIGGIGIGAVYFIRSRKALKQLEGDATGTTAQE